jgi:transcriptional regulator with XRE-family HTH domain
VIVSYLTTKKEANSPNIDKYPFFSHFCAMNIAENIKTIREEKNFKQIEVASYIGVDKSGYSKIEKGTRALTVEELQKMTQLFNLTADEILNFDGKIPQEVVIEDKTAIEQMRLLQMLEEEDRQTIFKLIDKMLTNKKFRDFFQKNLGS